MPHYIKSCPICFKQFYTYKISQVYCNKKCANKARGYKAGLLQALIDKANKATQVVDVVPRAVLEYMRKHVELKDKHGKTHITTLSNEDEQTVTQEAMALIKEREKQRLEHTFENDPALGSADGFKESAPIKPKGRRSFGGGIKRIA